jgi:hypothetical protein
MPQQNHNQVVGPDGTIISEEIVEVAVPVIGEAELQQAKQTIRSMVNQFWQDGAPTGTPTNVQLRNWNLAISVALRHLYREMDDE